MINPNKQYAHTKRIQQLETVADLLDDIVTRATYIATKHPTMFSTQDIILTVNEIKARLGIADSD